MQLSPETARLLSDLHCWQLLKISPSTYVGDLRLPPAERETLKGLRKGAVEAYRFRINRGNYFVGSDLNELIPRAIKESA